MEIKENRSESYFEFNISI